MQIRCKSCGKLIEKKVHRELCIKCTNKRDRELQDIYRLNKSKSGDVNNVES